MKVEFNRKMVFNRVPVSSELKENYQFVIGFIAEDFLKSLDTQCVVMIIIPNDFITEVNEKQRLLGYELSVTNTSEAKAFGKMLKCKDDDTYFIFVDADIAMFLLFEPSEKLVELFDGAYERLRTGEKPELSYADSKPIRDYYDLLGVAIEMTEQDPCYHIR